ncbi:MAG: hypothetical protein JRD47_00575 [Deltaproteobacteria bacterium]|nr:hypothetical protein [Deltaproteobacteria bacterium]MBW2317211.1 hypothetical protein [Deltaproteobacteria bacterium]MBW2600414.1 hypothetical protein [Deltaproteobacteria bacterium]
MKRNAADGLPAFYEVVNIGEIRMPANRAFWMSIIVATVFLTCCGKATIRTKGAVYTKGAIAVWNLENLTPAEHSRLDLGELLSTKIIETIKSLESYPVVERQHLLLALEELNLATTSLADESTRLRIGNMVGARFMIFGGYQVIAEIMRLDLRLVDVETGKIIKATQRTTPGTDLQGWLKAAQEAASELVP